MCFRKTLLRIAQSAFLFVLLGLIFQVAPIESEETTRLYGVLDDAGRTHRVAAAEVKTELVFQTGFNAVRHTVLWVQGQTTLNYRDLASIRNAVQAAEVRGLTVILTVYPYHDPQVTKTPTTVSNQRTFADFVGYMAETFPEVRHFEIGNEPNSSFFWRPQYRADGSDAASRAYYRMLPAEKEEFIEPG